MSVGLICDDCQRIFTLESEINAIFVGIVNLKPRYHLCDDCLSKFEHYLNSKSCESDGRCDG